MVKFEIEWSIEAREDQFNILNFYFQRNGNKKYSNKLNSIFMLYVNRISKNPLIGKATQIENVRSLITVDYEIIYKVSDSKIRMVKIWDCRVNPENKNIESRI